MFHALLVRSIAPFVVVATLGACRPDVAAASERARAYLLDVQPDLAGLEAHLARVAEANPDLAKRDDYRALLEALAAAREALTRLESATAPDQPHDLDRVAQAMLAAAAAWRTVERVRAVVEAAR